MRDGVPVWKARGGSQVAEFRAYRLLGGREVSVACVGEEKQARLSATAGGLTARAGGAEVPKVLRARTLETGA
jgi:hypothetical protein